MAKNILIRLTGDPDDAKDALDEILEKLKQLPDEVAVEISVEADEAKKDLDDLDVRLEALPRDELIRIQISADETKLDTLMAKLAAMKAAQDEMNAAGDESGANALGVRMGTVASQVQSVTSHMERLGSDLESLGDDGARDVSRLAGGFDSLGSRIGNVRTGFVSLVSDIVGKVPLLGGVFSSLTDGVGKLAALLPDAASGFAGMLAQGVALAAVVPVLVAIAAAAAALVVSIGMAVIGIAALADGFLVALAPIVLILGVVAEKIKDIVSGQTDLTSATANLKTAYQSVTEAVTTLHQAETNESTQRIAALQAEKQAVLAVQQAENTVAQDKMNVQQAALNVAEARTQFALFNQELAGVGSSPGDLQAASQNVMTSGNFGQTQAGASSAAWQAQLEQYLQLTYNIKDALIGQDTATITLKGDELSLAGVLETLQQYMEKGLKAYAPYQSALNEVATASQNVTKALDELKEAEIEKDQAIKHGATEAQSFEAAWSRLKATFSTIMGPGVAAVFKGIEKSMEVMAGHGQTLTPAFTKLGIAIGNAFVYWAKMMSKPGNLELIKTLIGESAGLVRTMSHWLGAVFKLLTQVGVDALPSLLKMVGHWASQLSNIELKHGEIKRFIDKCIGSATMWWDRLKDIAGEVIKLAGTFQKIEKFFGPLITLAEKLAKALGPVGTVLALLAVKAGGGGLVRSIAGLFGKGVGGLTGAAGGLGADVGSAGIGGALATGGLALGAGAGGLALGTLLDKALGLPSFLNEQRGPTAAEKDQEAADKTGDTQQKLMQEWSKTLQTGIEQYGPKMGSAVSATVMREIEQNILSMTGHAYKGSVARSLQAGETHNHVQVHMNQSSTVSDPHQFAAVLQRRLHSTGSSVH